MRCSKCLKEIHPQPDWTVCYWMNSEIDSRAVWQVATQECPACNQLLVSLTAGEGMADATGELGLHTVFQTLVIYPPLGRRVELAEEVPESYRKGLLEAAGVLQHSPKASAALSRRLLQSVLHSELAIKKRTLYDEIEDFIGRPGTPAYLADALHAVREIGNFAVHPIRTGSTSDIAEVEPGEADWLIETLESLFDYVFVQPRRLESRMETLNEKLAQAGKKPIGTLRGAV